MPTVIGLPARLQPRRTVFTFSRLHHCHAKNVSHCGWQPPHSCRWLGSESWVHQSTISAFLGCFLSRCDSQLGSTALAPTATPRANRFDRMTPHHLKAIARVTPSGVSGFLGVSDLGLKSHCEMAPVQQFHWHLRVRRLGRCERRPL